MTTNDITISQLHNILIHPIVKMENIIHLLKQLTTVSSSLNGQIISKQAYQDFFASDQGKLLVSQ